MSEWKSFDEAPEDLDDFVYVTDFISVWITQWISQEYYGGLSNKDRRWMEIEIPEVPKKKRPQHRCILGGLECREDSLRRLIIRYVSKPSSMFEQCNFCPLCGYSPNNDEINKKKSVCKIWGSDQKDEE